MQILNLSARYQPQVHALYSALRAPYSMLLESAEIADKSGKQSLIGLDCALKISVQERQVRLQPLNDNGLVICKELCQNLPLSHCGPYFEINFAPKTEPDEIKRLQEDGPFDVLRAIRQQLKDFSALIFSGLIAFDFIRSFESFPPLPDNKNDNESPADHQPDLCFYVYDLGITVNHLRKTLEINLFAKTAAEYERLALAALKLKAFIDEDEFKLELPQGKSNPCFTTDLDDETFGSVVSALKGHIKKGDIFQAVPSRSFFMDCPQPYTAYCCLKSDNPSPYAFYFEDPDFILFGASPEFALRFDAKNREVAISPIAGTRPRGLKADGSPDPDLDTRLELELRTDAKEISEHLMLVDLARNDLARIAIPGSRLVKNMLHVDRYQSVMHLVSDVRATLRPELDAFHAYLASMNMGTLSGAPKIKAHELIYRYEGKKRGFYGGSVALICADGSFDSCIVIRSALVKNGRAQIQAGCGVVVDSNPQAEAQETLNKARSVLLAIARSNLEA